MPSRNPLPLSASQEAQVREVFNAQVRTLCADEIKGWSFHVILPTYTRNLSLSDASSIFPPLFPTHATAIYHLKHPKDHMCVRTQLTRPVPNKTAFADCARNRTFSIPFACRDASRRMNGCMLAHATPEEHDRAREQWFAQRQQRAREREQKERRKLEQEAFHREWWGLPQRDPEEVKKELEKLGRAERVGGLTRRPPGGGEQGETKR